MTVQKVTVPWAPRSGSLSSGLMVNWPSGVEPSPRGTEAPWIASAHIAEATRPLMLPESVLYPSPSLGIQRCGGGGGGGGSVWPRNEVSWRRDETG